MEVDFARKGISCLDTALQQLQNSEQTLELKLPEGMPDVGKVLTAWGQPILRGKEWREDQVQCTGGMMVWVLYKPEDASEYHWIQGWLPFQMRWDLPENCQEGTLRLRCLTRFVDGRSTSPRKILVRAGLAVLAEAFVPTRLETAVPQEPPADVALLENSYPVRIMKESGEKRFHLEEELYLPDSAPKMDKLITWRMCPRITDQRVLADKAVLRGMGNLYVLYRSDTGQFHSWEFDVPFSQYVDLQAEYSGDARIEIAMMPTAMELDLQENGKLDLRGAMTAQYLITDKECLTLAEDAYSHRRDLTVHQENLMLPVVLENHKENLYGEQSLSAQVNLPVDVQFLPDFPRQRRTENGVELENSGRFHVLYYGEDGELYGSDIRWEGKQLLSADENSRIAVFPMGAEAQTVPGNAKMMLKAEIPMEWTTTARQAIPMVTGLELGQPKQPDPACPSLILRRAGDSSLWDIAKASGSTIDAIRRANNLSGEPVPGQMLLIPVP